MEEKKRDEDMVRQRWVAEAVAAAAEAVAVEAAAAAAAERAAAEAAETAEAAAVESAAADAPPTSEVKKRVEKLEWQRLVDPPPPSHSPASAPACLGASW